MLNLAQKTEQSSFSDFAEKFSNRIAFVSAPECMVFALVFVCLFVCKCYRRGASRCEQ